MQVTRTTIVAQSLPFAQHFILRGGRQIVDRRPTTHKALPIGTTLLNACLLGDDFREPNGIRVTRFTPRQRTTILLEPLQYNRTETHGLLTHEGTNLVLKVTATSGLKYPLIHDGKAEHMTILCRAVAS